MSEGLARRIVLALLGRIRHGSIELLEGDRRIVLGAGDPRATVVVSSARAWPALLRGGLGLGESYVAGWWDSPDVTAVLNVAARNLERIDALRRALTPVREPFQRGRALLTRNTPARSRRGIAAHYDLGNDLFEAMLDPTMTYSCAVFENPEATLEEAQVAKLERMCRTLDLRQDDRVLEIGTGWGSFALHAASTRGCHVTTTTLSARQHELATRRVREAGLADRVTVLCQDYRELRGTFDKLVSIEMIEAVGWKDFGTFFRACSDRLAHDGVMALQAIVIEDRLYEIEKASRTFIRTHVFPDGCLPSVAVISRSAARHGDLRVVGIEDISVHYPETLRRWRANLHEHAARLDATGYDERFRRLWHLYLCWCEAGFEVGRISDVQVVLAKAGWRPPVAAAALTTARA